MNHCMHSNGLKITDTKCSVSIPVAIPSGIGNEYIGQNVRISSLNKVARARSLQPGQGSALDFLACQWCGTGSVVDAEIMYQAQQ